MKVNIAPSRGPSPIGPGGSAGLAPDFAAITASSEGGTPSEAGAARSAGCANTASAAVRAPKKGKRLNARQGRMGRAA